MENDKYGNPLLLKEVIYTNIAPPYVYAVKYYMQSDYDIRRNLPVEKRYKKTYYPNGKVQYQWIFEKGSGTSKVYNKIETWYDEGGKLTEKIIRTEKDEIVTTNGVTPADERDTYTVNKATFLFRGIDENIEDTLTSIKEGTILSINMNDQENPRFPGLGLTQFFKAIYKGKTGYVYSKDLTFVSDNKSLKMAPLVETDKYKVDETRYLFREPDLFSDTLIEVEKGTDLTTKSIESKDFKKVTHKGITGYIYFLTLSPLSK